MMYFFVICAVIILVLFIYVYENIEVDLTLKYCELFGEKVEKLRGKVVWITGASSGIGEYLAYELASVGCKLVLSARRKEELERVKAKCAGMVWLKGQTKIQNAAIHVYTVLFINSKCIKGSSHYLGYFIAFESNL